MREALFSNMSKAYHPKKPTIFVCTRSEVGARSYTENDMVGELEEATLIFMVSNFYQSSVNRMYKNKL